MKFLKMFFTYPELRSMYLYLRMLTGLTLISEEKKKLKNVGGRRRKSFQTRQRDWILF